MVYLKASEDCISSTHHKDGKNKKYNFATEHFYEETKNGEIYKC